MGGGLIMLVTMSNILVWLLWCQDDSLEVRVEIDFIKIEERKKERKKEIQRTGTIICVRLHTN